MTNFTHEYLRHYSTESRNYKTITKIIQTILGLCLALCTLGIVAVIISSFMYFSDGDFDVALWLFSYIDGLIICMPHFVMLSYYVEERAMERFWSDIADTLLNGHLVEKILCIVLVLPFYLVELVISIFIGTKRDDGKIPF